MSDATALLKFHHLVNNHKLGKPLFAKVGGGLPTCGFKVTTGTIVDASIIGASDSIKNAMRAFTALALVNIYSADNSWQIRVGKQAERLAKRA